MIRGIHHVGINCRDLDRMIRFYTEAFGFEQVHTMGWEKSPFLDTVVDVPGSACKGALMRCGNAYIELFQYSAPPPRVDEPLKPNDRGYTHFCVDVTDMANDIEHFRKCGMDFGEREYGDFGVSKAIYGYDPEGNVIEIQECGPGNANPLTALMGGK